MGSSPTSVATFPGLLTKNGMRKTLEKSGVFVYTGVARSRQRASHEWLLMLSQTCAFRSMGSAAGETSGRIGALAASLDMLSALAVAIRVTRN